MTDDKPHQLPAELAFEYEKGNFYRVIHVDGGHGGLSPDGRHLVFSVYNERRPIPKREVFKLDPNGALIQPPRKEERDGIFREVEATLIMNTDTATAIKDWLEAYLTKQKGLLEQIGNRHALVLGKPKEQ